MKEMKMEENINELKSKKRKNKEVIQVRSKKQKNEIEEQKINYHLDASVQPLSMGTHMA